MGITSLSFGLALGDPLGLVARIPVKGLVDVQLAGGARLLCPDDARCGFPGPLVTGDALIHAPPRNVTPGDLDVHAGLGMGFGTVSPGCWYDAVAEFCVDEVSFSAMIRAPIGFDLRMRRVEIGLQIVPAIRALPDPHATFLGGLQFRYVPDSGRS